MDPDNLEWYRETFDAVSSNIEQVIRGKRSVIEQLVLCLIAEGHVLIEDVPGVGKTLLAKSLARSIEGSFRRIQFTPDLLPSDITGVSIWNRDDARFEFQAGAIFANVVVGDEINRASPKTQAALLEAMEERQVTVDGTTHPLSPPFMVVATQNPLEHEGTYPLPEAQLDRFMARLEVGYPDRVTSLDILETHGETSSLDDLESAVHAKDVLRLTEISRTVHVSEAVRGYLTDLIDATRSHTELLLGASPRSALYMFRLSKARAASRGDEYVTPDDLKAIAHPVLVHRMMLRPEAHMRGTSIDRVLDDILERVRVPGAPR